MRPQRTIKMTKATATEVQSRDGVRPLRADARRNRQAVIDAASQLFADRGLEAQMPDVARAANVGVGPYTATSRPRIT